MHLLVPSERKERWVLGVVPHYRDADDPVLRKLVASSPSIKLIDICGGVDRVIEEVRSCRAVVGSAMHGLILADALGVPNVWMVPPSRASASRFKYHDYYSALGIADPLRITLAESDTLDALMAHMNGYRRDRLAEVQRGLVEAFPFKD
jgi:pyruvyltransferase